MYSSMSQAVFHWKVGDLASCLGDVACANEALSRILHCYHTTMNDSKIPRAYWMRYAQGFQAWGCEHIVNGVPVVYEGLSGNQLLAFQAVDAFLGMEPYLSLQDLQRYIPRDQRRFIESLQANSFYADSRCNLDLLAEMQNMATLAKVCAVHIVGERSLIQIAQKFREAHRARVRPYLGQAAPERKMMTAGKGVLEKEGRSTLKSVLDFLDGFLLHRLSGTVDVLRRRQKK